MTTKILTGAYNAGYTLASVYSTLTLTHSAYVGGTGVVANKLATVVNGGEILAAAGADGGVYQVGSVGHGGILLTAGGKVTDTYLVYGGMGGRGYPSFHDLAGFAGGVGGAGIDLLSGGDVTVSYGGSPGNTRVGGGRGGYGGYSNYTVGGAGGAGGAAVQMAHGTFTSTAGVLVKGGMGGQGGNGFYSGGGVSGDGAGGAGGDGLDLASADGVAKNGGTLRGGYGGHGSNTLYNAASNGGGGGIGLSSATQGAVSNSGVIVGGGGGFGGNSGHSTGGYPPGGVSGAGGAGGAGVQLSAGGSPLVNTGTILGGQGGGGGFTVQSRAGASADGGAGVILTAAREVDNHGSISGGAGGHTGGAGASGFGYSSQAPGGAGGFGIYLTAGGSVNNDGAITGGRGGDGARAFYGELTGGVGGAAVLLTAGGTVTDSGTITGGQGGAGGDGGKYTGGTGGAGGIGIALTQGGSVSISGTVVGGVGGAGGNGGESPYPAAGGGAGGAGILLADGRLSNAGAIMGGLGGAGGYSYSPFAFGPTGATGDGVVLVGGCALTNGPAVTALIEGGVGVYAYGGAATVKNFGTIEGTSGVAVNFHSAADRLIVEAGSMFGDGLGGLGDIAGGGGTLEMAGDGGVIVGLGGAAQLNGSSLGNFSGFGAYVFDAGTTSTLQGSSKLASAQRLTLANGAVLFEDSGAFVNTGAIKLASTGAATDLRIQAASATLSGGGAVTLTGPKSRIWGTATTATLTNFNNTISGSGWLGLSELTLINQAKGVIEAVGAQGLVVNTKGATSTNAGIIESAPGSVLTLQNSTFNQTDGGTIAALTGGRVLLSDDVIMGGTLSQAGTGVFNVNTSGGELQAVAISGLVNVLRGVTLTLDGAIANAGKLNTHGGASATKLIVGPDGATLSGGGQVSLSASVNNLIVGAASGDVLTNVDNRIAGAGDIGDGSMVLINKGQIVGSTAVTLTLDTGASAITNSGTISSVSTGQVVVKSALANTGLIFAAAGTLTLDGAVTGTGTGQIKNGVLDIAASFGETVTFVSGATGQLRLTDWRDFTGTVKGLSLTGTNTIDLAGFTKTGATASYSGATASGVLTVTNGTQTARIHLTGNYTASTFTVANDGSGGVLVKDPAGPGAPLAAAPLIHAMAGLGHDSPPHCAGAPAYQFPRIALFVARS